VIRPGRQQTAPEGSSDCAQTPGTSAARFPRAHHRSHHRVPSLTGGRMVSIATLPSPSSHCLRVPPLPSNAKDWFSNLERSVLMHVSELSHFDCSFNVLKAELSIQPQSKKYFFLNSLYLYSYLSLDWTSRYKNCLVKLWFPFNKPLWQAIIHAVCSVLNVFSCCASLSLDCRNAPPWMIIISKYELVCMKWCTRPSVATWYWFCSSAL